jgi:hypothetical protein
LALNSNYALSFVGADLTITARPVQVTAEGKTKVYGDADPALTYQITNGSLALGDAFSGALTRDAGQAVGSYAITQGSLALNSNYNLTFVGANLAITARPIQVTADAKTKVYGDADPGLTYQITSGALAFSDTFAGGLTRAAGETVGTYAIGQGTLALNANYNLAFVGANLSITARPIQVTADGKTKVYGGTDPALTYKITNGSLAFTDAFTGALTRAAGGNVGTYAITQGTLALNANYSLSFVAASFTITPKAAKITADNKNKLLGAENPPLTATIEGVIPGDALNYNLTTTAVTNSSVGSYPITVTPGSNPNYNVTPVNGVLSIAFRWDGFLQPINDTAHDLGAMSKFRLGSTIPAKFQLKNAAGVVVQQATNPGFRAVRISSACTGTELLETAEAITADSSPSYKWDGTQYHYGWSTKGLAAGLYTVAADLSDATSKEVTICLTR